MTPPPAPLNLTLTNDTGLIGDAVTANTQLVFTWAAPADLTGIAGYQYSVDSGNWVATTNTAATVTLAEGSHLFGVRAIDNAGNVGSVASLQVAVDLTPPEAPAGLRLDGSTLCPTPASASMSRSSRTSA
jgi:hypothetical protein